jgi:C1A family cysteine protease
MKKYFIPLFFALISCGEHSFDNPFEDVFDELFGTGLVESDMSIVPQDVKNFSDASASGFPKSISLESKFPPVQSQGSYGTCTVWSTGYAFKTALNAIEKNWSPYDLENPANQTRHKDLWLSIPADKKNKDCNGVSVSYAMDALIASGAASMADVPYDMKNSCDASPSTAKGDPNSKLANYRKIAFNQNLYSKPSTKVEGMTLENFKSYLAQGRPIAFSAKLGDRFKSWKSTSVSVDVTAVLSSDYNQTRGHAMVLAGYDDSRGTNGAFRVRNSWGATWGDKGSIWVDYDYFLKDFCMEAFVAQNPNSPPDPNPPNPAADGYDLLASLAEDYHDPEDKTNNLRKRAFSYKVHNNGTKDILANQRWGVYYLYYNAYDANEYEIIFEDYYTDERGKPCTKPGDFDNEVCWGKYESKEAIAGAIWNNMNVKPGKMAGEVEAGDDGYLFEIPYEMPNITGDYYLVLYADYKDVIKETNEDNNFYFITAENGKPLRYKNGVMQSKPANTVASSVLSKRAKPAPAHSVVDLGELNGYTQQEIKTLLNIDKKNGILAKKIAQYRETATPVKRIRRQ